jgi:hypothetical protein
MATPINAPMAAEIWHLSIEDLFQPVQEAPRLGGDGPFVINLSVSTAPISVPAKAFAGCHDAHIYQIQVTEDGRTRFRLRLGPFMSEDEADTVLAAVRDTYPGALTATASASDLRVIGTMQAKVDARHSGVHVQLSSAVVEKAPVQQAPAQKAAPAQKVAPKEITPPAPAAPVAPAAQKPAEKTAAPPPVSQKVAPAPPPENFAAEKATAELDAEISIDIAWPTPALVVPAAPTARKPEPKWVLPELDIPLPNAAAGKLAKDAPVLTEIVAPQPKPASLKAAAPAPAAAAPIVAAPKAASVPVAVAPTPIAVAAPTLTEAVTAKSRVPAAPVIKAPIPKPIAAVAVVAAAAAGPAPAPSPTRPVVPAISSPVKQAAPKVAEKPAPVLTQSVASAKAAPPKGRQSTFNISATKLTSLQHVVVATAAVPGAREIKKLDEPLESLESTQTMRALTPPELADIGASRWFVIQLALADHAFDPDAVPNLDIFDEYRLYSVAGLDQGRVVHSLRLGFFREEIGAVAVASYLAAYWEKPTIKRVSLAERERFAVQRVQARKDVGATGKHAVIEITDELVARRRHAPKPVVSSKSSNQPLGH